MELRGGGDACATARFSRDADECHLNLSAANNREDESDEPGENDTQPFKQKDIVHSLSGLYAVILIVVTGSYIFWEIVHKDLPLFYTQDFLFIYHFGVGILLLGTAYVKQINKCFSQQDSVDNLGCSPQKLTSNRKDFTNNLYFKIAGFVFGSVVILVTLLEIFSIFSSPTKCLDNFSASCPIFRCVFIFLQIFIVRNPMETIRKFGCLRNFAIMHLFAANFSSWLRLLLWESAKDWEDTFHIKHNSSMKWEKNYINFTVHSLDSDIFSEDKNDHYPSHDVHYTANCWWRPQKVIEVDVSSVLYCLQHSPIGFFWGQANRFLYPLLSQYYFVITGILYIIWYSCNMKQKHFSLIMPKQSSEIKMRTRSSKGFFLGSISFGVTLILAILCFTIHKSMDLPVNVLYFIISLSSFVASTLGLTQVRSMLTWKTYIGFIKLFQKIGLLSLIVYGICSLIFEFLSKQKYFFLSFSVTSMIMHGCAQYLFIIDVSRKKVDVVNVLEKPGRQAVAFLIFSNMSLWVLDTFVDWNSFKYSSGEFSSPMFPLMTRWLLPIVAFYRVHSITVLADAWSNAYE